MHVFDRSNDKCGNKGIYNTGNRHRYHPVQLRKLASMRVPVVRIRTQRTKKARSCCTLPRTNQNDDEVGRSVGPVESTVRRTNETTAHGKIIQYVTHARQVSNGSHGKLSREKSSNTNSLPQKEIHPFHK
jgi:hypothetical protein